MFIMTCLWDIHTHTYSDNQFMICNMKYVWYAKTSTFMTYVWYEIWNMKYVWYAKTSTYIRPAIRAISKGLSPWTQPVQFNPSTSCKCFDQSFFSASSANFKICHKMIFSCKSSFLIVCFFLISYLLPKKVKVWKTYIG